MYLKVMCPPMMDVDVWLRLSHSHLSAEWSFLHSSVDDQAGSSKHTRIYKVIIVNYCWLTGDVSWWIGIASSWWMITRHSLIGSISNGIHWLVTKQSPMTCLLVNQHHWFALHHQCIAWLPAIHLLGRFRGGGAMANNDRCKASGY